MVPECDAGPTLERRQPSPGRALAEQISVRRDNPERVTCIELDPRHGAQRPSLRRIDPDKSVRRAHPHFTAASLHDGKAIRRARGQRFDPSTEEVRANHVNVLPSIACQTASRADPENAGRILRQGEHNARR
jgi:hypothetical protein